MPIFDKEGYGGTIISVDNGYIGYYNSNGDLRVVDLGIISLEDTRRIKMPDDNLRISNTHVDAAWIEKLKEYCEPVGKPLGSYYGSVNVQAVYAEVKVAKDTGTLPKTLNDFLDAVEKAADRDAQLAEREKQEALEEEERRRKEEARVKASMEENAPLIQRHPKYSILQLGAIDNYRGTIVAYKRRDSWATVFLPNGIRKSLRINASNRPDGVSKIAACFMSKDDVISIKTVWGNLETVGLSESFGTEEAEAERKCLTGGRYRDLFEALLLALSDETPKPKTTPNRDGDYIVTSSAKDLVIGTITVDIARDSDNPNTSTFDTVTVSIPIRTLSIKDQKSEARKYQTELKRMAIEAISANRVYNTFGVSVNYLKLEGATIAGGLLILKFGIKDA